MCSLHCAYIRRFLFLNRFQFQSLHELRFRPSVGHTSPPCPQLRIFHSFNFLRGCIAAEDFGRHQLVLCRLAPRGSNCTSPPCRIVFRVSWPPHQAIEVFPFGHMGTVQTSSVPFFGWEWNLLLITLRPSALKLSKAVFDTRKALKASVLFRDDVFRVLGKLVWCVLGVRPSLSVLFRSYMFTSDDSYNEEDVTNLSLQNAVRKKCGRFLD